MTAAKDDAGSSSPLSDLSLAIGALRELLEMIYAKSTCLGHLAVILIMICPVYAIYTWGKFAKAERAADSAPRQALETKIAKGKKAGGKKNG